MLNVFAERCRVAGFIKNLSHRFNAGRVEFAQFIDMREDLVQFFRHAFDFLFIESEIGEVGDVSYFLFGDFQAFALFRAAL